MSTVRVGELEMAYQTAGEGPCLILVAGTGYPGATWLPRTVGRLAERFTVVTYDHRGTGGTTGPTGPFSTLTLAEDALGLLDALDLGPATVLGHSMGGRVAQWMAITGSDQVGRLVLAASGAGPLAGTSGHTLGVPVGTAASIVELGYRGYIGDVQRRSFFTAEFAAAEPDAVQWLQDAFWEHRPSLVDYLQHVAARQQHDTRDRLAEIHQPTLVIVGDQDTHQGGTGSHVEQSEHLARELPDASFHLLRGVKHGFFWEKPDESVEPILRWLAAG